MGAAHAGKAVAGPPSQCTAPATTRAERPGTAPRAAINLNAVSAGAADLLRQVWLSFGGEFG